MMTTDGFNAVKVFVAGAVMGVFALEGYYMLTRDARGPVCIIPFMPSASTYSCTADPQGPAERPCKCTECGMRAEGPKPET
jgi:hypothetical protein